MYHFHHFRRIRVLAFRIGMASIVITGGDLIPAVTRAGIGPEPESASTAGPTSVSRLLDGIAREMEAEAEAAEGNCELVVGCDKGDVCPGGVTLEQGCQEPAPDSMAGFPSITRAGPAPVPAPVPGPDNTCTGSSPRYLGNTGRILHPAVILIAVPDQENVSDPVHLSTGEYYYDVVDLRIPGRGFDFVFKRKYRSKTGHPTSVGNNWDFSYNISLVRAGSGPNADLVLFDGSGRIDWFEKQGDGSWGRPEFLRTIEEVPGTLIMRHKDATQWKFFPFDSPCAGKISLIKDRNGNIMKFFYNQSCQLVEIRDTLGAQGRREIALAYNADGFLESVTDWTGRQITYQYYHDGDAGGSDGDLKSVTYPVVVRTNDFPIPENLGHEYPQGKTWIYTYTTGFDDERLNHDLLTITDGRRNDPNDPTFGAGPYLENFYAHTIDPLDPRYTIDPANRLFGRTLAQVYGGEQYDYTYIRGLDPDDPENNGAVRKTIVNNRRGEVKELFFDIGNRIVIRRDYTGFAPDPAAPTTNTDNRPTGKLRPDDPDYFETLFGYNNDSQVKRIVQPNGNTTEFIYEQDLCDQEPDSVCGQVPDPDYPCPSPARSRGNLRVVVRDPGPLGGDQPCIQQQYDYGTDFNFVTRVVDGRGHETLYVYDDRGNRTHTRHRIESIVEDWEYNQHGQVTAHIGPDNGTGHRRRDEFTYYDSGHQKGYLRERIIDAGGFALTTTYDYDPVGNVTRIIDPKGHDTQYVYNQYNQVVRRKSREVEFPGDPDSVLVGYERDTWYDANNNVVRVDVQNIDDAGNVVDDNSHFTTIHEYDILNDVTRTCQESGSHDVPRNPPQLTCDGLPASDFITTESEYDRNKNRTLVRYGEATNGNQPNNAVRTLYDERNLVFRVTRGTAEQDPANVQPGQSTTQYDYDRNGNLTKIHQGLEEGTPRRYTYNYDGYDRVWNEQDQPAYLDPMGNVSEYHYDANGKLGGDQSPGVPNPFAISVSGEMQDGEGSGGNVRLSQTMFEYDEMDRSTRIVAEFFDTETQDPIGDGQSITQISYSDNSQAVSIIDDNGHETIVTYDTANRRSVVTDAKLNTVTLDYDANSNVETITEVEKSDLPEGQDETFATTFAYDNLDRLTRRVDNVGNTNRYGYDSRSNRTVTTDALNRETRYAFDGVSRRTETVRDMNGNGASSTDEADIVTRRVWDDTWRLIAQIDDNGNVTRDAYDELGRSIITRMADGTMRFVGTGEVIWPDGKNRPTDLGSFEPGYDVHGNPTAMTDANASVVQGTFDLLNRLMERTIAPGPDVSDDTTFEAYTYDGLSRIRSATDDDSEITLSFDSLSRVTRETLNGRTTSSRYDGVGNLRECTYPGGREVTCDYDDLDRKSTISDAGGFIASYLYVGPGRVARRDYGNGTRAEFTYDGITGIPNPPNDFAVKRIIGTRHVFDPEGPDPITIDRRTYTWDRMYNKTQRRDIRPDGPQLTHDYTYDAIYRLIQTAVTDAFETVVRDTTYNLDGVHNRIDVIGNPDDGRHVGPYTMTEGDPLFDAEMNQYTTTPHDIRAYDDNGNLVAIGLGDADGSGVVDLADYAIFVDCVTGPDGDVMPAPCTLLDFDADSDVDLVDFGRFQLVFGAEIPGEQTAVLDYDYRNQMVVLHDMRDGQQHNYGYDALGRRIQKVVDTDGAADETRYFYQGWRAIEEQDGTDVTQATYVYGNYIDEVLTMQRDTDDDGTPEDYFYHADDLFNVMAVTDAVGTVVERYEYGDYGDPSIFDGSGIRIPQSETRNPYLFTGRRFDPETGFYYYRTRYLDPVAGRFTTRDTIGIWGDPLNVGNGYTYSASNPSSWVDPLGLCSPGRPCGPPPKPSLIDSLIRTVIDTITGTPLGSMTDPVLFQAPIAIQQYADRIERMSQMGYTGNIYKPRVLPSTRRRAPAPAPTAPVVPQPVPQPPEPFVPTGPGTGGGSGGGTTEGPTGGEPPEPPEGGEPTRANPCDPATDPECHGPLPPTDGDPETTEDPEGDGGDEDG